MYQDSFLLLICLTIKNEAFKRVLIAFTYRKIPKISPGAYIFQKPFLRGLSTEGNLRFKIDWASLILGSKFKNCFTLYLRAIFQIQAQGDLTEGFLRYWIGGLIFGGAYFRNFTEGIYKGPAFLDLCSLRSLLLSYSLKPFYGVHTDTYGHFRGHINPRTFTQIHTPTVVENCSGTVYAVIYEVVNTKNRSEPLRGITHV